MAVGWCGPSGCAVSGSPAEDGAGESGKVDLLEAGLVGAP